MIRFSESEEGMSSETYSAWHDVKCNECGEWIRRGDDFYIIETQYFCVKCYGEK